MVLNDVDCVLKVLVEICVQGRLEEARKFTITILIVTNYSLLLFIFFFISIIIQAPLQRNTIRLTIL